VSASSTVLVPPDGFVAACGASVSLREVKTGQDHPGKITVSRSKTQEPVDCCVPYFVEIP
jgi:hypothetical protein